MSDQDNIPKILRGRRVIVVILICLGLSAALFIYEQSNSPLKLSEFNWTSSSYFYLFLAIVMMAFRDLAYMVRIRYLTDRYLSWKQSFNVIMLWEFASALTPGVAGGSTVAMFILKGEKIPIGKATSLVITTAIMDNLFYILALPILFLSFSSSLIFPTDFDWYEKGGEAVFWTGYGLVCGVTFILFISVFFVPKILDVIVKIIFRLPFLNKRKEQGQKIVDDIYLTSKELKSRSLIFWLQVFGATVWSWSARFLVINFMLLAFIELGIIDNLVILARQLVMWLVMLVTPTPGSGGMAEFLFSEFLSDFLSSGSLAVALAFVWRLISYYPYLIIGSIIYPRWMRR